MQSTMKMAGYFAGHALWSVSDGEILIPIVGYQGTDGNSRMERLAMGSAQAVALGNQRISNLEDSTKGGVFIKDGIVTLETGKTDALVVDVRFTEDAGRKLQILLPYRNAKHADGFAVHRLQLTEFAQIPKEAVQDLMEAFLTGLDSHEQGGKILREQYVEQAGSGAVSHGEENTDFALDDFDALKRSLFMIFFLVAASDGQVDKKELQAFLKILSDPERFGSPLLNRIVTNIIADLPTIVSAIAAERLDYIAELGRLRGIIDTNLAAERANEFKLALLRIGYEIASSSGGFLGFGSKVSKQEKRALAAIALCLGVSIN